MSAEHKNRRQLSREGLIDRLIEIFDGSIYPLRMWAPFFIDRNNTSAEDALVFPIFFCCVRDMAIVMQRHMPDLISSAEAIGETILHANTIEIGLQCIPAAEFVSRFSEDEQIYLEIVRNRLVHGYLDGRHKPSRNITIVLDGKIYKVEKTREQQRQIVHKFEEPGPLRGLAQILNDHRQDLETYLGSELLSVPPELISEIRKLISRNSLIVFEENSLYSKP